MFNIISHKRIFLSVSVLLTILAVASIVMFGFKPGIDFSGGTLWQISIPDPETTREEVGSFIAEVTESEGAIITTGDTSGHFLVRMRETDEASHAVYLTGLKEKFPGAEELGFETIGAAIGEELRSRALYAFVFVLLAISLYIAFAFRKVSRPVASWKYGLITLVTLFHDALIPAGLMAFLGHYHEVELDTNFIVAILVVMGFSVHDTIVVFDRIREHLRTSRGEEDFNDLVNESVNQTMARSINTSVTLVLVLVALLFFGAPSLHYFILMILVGTIIGTYSSIFVASPLLTLWKQKRN